MLRATCIRYKWTALLRTRSYCKKHSTALPSPGIDTPKTHDRHPYRSCLCHNRQHQHRDWYQHHHCTPISSSTPQSPLSSLPQLVPSRHSWLKELALPCPPKVIRHRRAGCKPRIPACRRVAVGLQVVLSSPHHPSGRPLQRAVRVRAGVGNGAQHGRGMAFRRL